MNDTSTIADQILNGINIPPCPDTLASIMKEAKRPHTTLPKLAELISRDAGIVAPLLKLANSPFVGLRSKVTSVTNAVNVLGADNTLTLVQNIALRQSLGGGKHNFEKFWERSTISASVAARIAARMPHISRDDAYIATLFHDCGIPVLIMKFPLYRETVMAQCRAGRNISEVEDEYFKTTHSMVGSMLARSWLLPEYVCQAIRHHHENSVFEEGRDKLDDKILDLIGLVHIAESVTDEYLNVRDKEWPQHEAVVLRHFELSESEFAELQSDMLAYLNAEL